MASIFADRKHPKTGPHPSSLLDFAIWVFAGYQVLTWCFPDQRRLLSFILAVLAYMGAVSFYRLYLSPLRKIPGPPLGIITYWYELLYDVWPGIGQYTEKIGELHDKYGPIIRINPHEVHIKDHTFYTTLYVERAKRRSHKWTFTSAGFDLYGSVLVTPDHDIHSRWRASLNPFFGKSTVLKVEYIIQDKVERLCNRLEEWKGKSEPVNLNYAFSAVANDIVSTYFFARPYGTLDVPDFDPSWEDVVLKFAATAHLMNHFSFIQPIAKMLPRSVLALIDPRMLRIFEREKMLEGQIKEILDGNNKDYLKNFVNGHGTIFHDIIFNSNLPPQDLQLERLRDEGQGLVMAGTITTSRSLYMMAYFLLANPEVLRKLRDELREPMKDYPVVRPKWTELERLPYLSAVIKEGLRLGHGSSHRLARVFPDYDLPYGDLIVPRNTPIGMSGAFMDEHPGIFKSPSEFDPERWLRASPSELAEMNRCSVPFGKGSRSCMGINLAHAELYNVIAAVFRPGWLEMELFETTEKDVRRKHDFMADQPDLNSKGVRVLIK